MIKKDVIIIGAGASGMMCAISSGKRGHSVLVLDHASKIGKKIRISRGGSCNFTNIITNHANYLSIFSELSGISIEAAIKCNDMKFRGNLLFTHKGLSGPAILQVSSYWKEGDAIVIDLLPEIDIFSTFNYTLSRSSRTLCT
jgi:predicted flavoprotein YhiN